MASSDEMVLLLPSSVYGAKIAVSFLASGASITEVDRRAAWEPANYTAYYIKSAFCFKAPLLLSAKPGAVDVPLKSS